MSPLSPSRRTFLRHTASIGAFTLAASIPLGTARAQTSKPIPWLPPYDPNVFLQIRSDNTVTLISKHSELGQGITTGLATLVAEELDADWSQMRFDFAPTHWFLYKNLEYSAVFPLQVTGGSTSTSEAWTQMRQMGAAARAMFVTAAARSWKVSESTIKIENGVVRSGTHKATLGHLAAAAMAVLPPLSVKLKAPTDWRLIGANTPLPRLDSVMKTTGAAKFGLDVRRPGMLTVVVRRPDAFGAKIVSVDDSATRKIPGVVDVQKLPSGGVAVYATNTWAAMQGRNALKVTCDLSQAETRSSKDMFDEYRSVLGKPGGLIAVRRGDAAGALGRAAKKVDAEFQIPFLAHAPMEPLNCMVELSARGAEILSGCQAQTVDHWAAAVTLGLLPDQVKINTMLAGGSFGRRASPSGSWVIEACQAARAIGGRAPIHLVWSREDDIKGGFYRPMALHRVQAGVTSDGRLSGWSHELVSKSVFTDVSSIPLINWIFDTLYVNSGLDSSSVDGIKGTLYAIDDFQVIQHNAITAVPVQWWRSVGNSHTAFVVETVVDELATVAGVDPVKFRLDHLAHDSRALAVVKLAQQQSGWATPLAGAGRGRGFAFHYSFNTRVAMVAEVTVSGNTIKVDRIVAAVDVGTAVNPDVVRSQVEGAVGFSLSSVLRNQITLIQGKVEQGNFDDYEPTRMREMPEVKVYIVPCAEDPSGIGEPGVPVVAPAIGNAIAAATGKRLRTLPFGYTTPLPKG
jgi:isoquinoline 1-oxidoreductase beta subunit